MKIQYKQINKKISADNEMSFIVRRFLYLNFG